MKCSDQVIVDQFGPKLASIQRILKIVELEGLYCYGF